MRRLAYLLFVLLLFLVSCASSNGSSTQQTPTATPTESTAQQTSSSGKSSIPGIQLPQGFQISVYAKGLSNPRFMAVGPNNTLLVANRGANTIVAYPSQGAPAAQAGNPVVVASDLQDPTSLVMHDGYLYVGEGSAIVRMRLSNDLKAGPIERVIPNLPLGGQHNTRTVLIGPDNHIYVSIGSTCNVCIESDAHRAAIWIYNMDGSGGRLYAKGLRNAVGMAINPWNNSIWIDVNGRDELGDNVPPETVYALTEGDYGWPRCHAGTIRDPQFGQSADACNGVQQPLLTMQAHSAPLGMAFYSPQATQFPSNYRDSLYIAFHGSWNRSTPTGYKVVRIPLKNGKIAGPAEDFITGWLMSNGNSTGRPTGVTFMPDGTLFISDDTHGVIYHIWYQS